MTNRPRSLGSAVQTPIQEFYKALQFAVHVAERERPEGMQLRAYFYTQGGERLLIQALGYSSTDMLRIYGIDQRNHHSIVLAHMTAVQLVLKYEQIEQEAPTARSAIRFIGTEPPA